MDPVFGSVLVAAITALGTWLAAKAKSNSDTSTVPATERLNDQLNEMLDQAREQVKLGWEQVNRLKAEVDALTSSLEQEKAARARVETKYSYALDGLRRYKRIQLKPVQEVQLHPDVEQDL